MLRDVVNDNVYAGAKRWTLLLAVSALVVLAACASHNGSTQKAELRKMRHWWRATTVALLPNIDTINEISHSLKQRRNDVGKNYYFVPEPLKNDVSRADEQAGWDDVGQALKATVSSVNDAIDATKAANAGDGNKVQVAIKAVLQVKRRMCSALAAARVHYVAAGGAASDLRYAYNSEWADPPCTLIDGPPRRATVTREAILFQASELGEHWDEAQSDPPDQMLADGHARRVPAGTRVTVMESRRPEDNARALGVGPECRVRISGADWWTPCATLSTR